MTGAADLVVDLGPSLRRYAVGMRCSLEALPRDAEPPPHDAAKDYLSCATCGAVVPVADIMQLQPGRCPGSERERATV